MNKLAQKHLREKIKFIFTCRACWVTKTSSTVEIEFGTIGGGFFSPSSSPSLQLSGSSSGAGVGARWIKYSFSLLNWKNI